MRPSRLLLLGVLFLLPACAGVPLDYGRPSSLGRDPTTAEIPLFIPGTALQIATVAPAGTSGPTSWLEIGAKVAGVALTAYAGLNGAASLVTPKGRDNWSNVLLNWGEGSSWGMKGAAGSLLANFLGAHTPDEAHVFKAERAAEQAKLAVAA